MDRRTLVSDVKVEQKQALSREEVARFLSTLAQGLADGGKVAVQLGNGSLELSVADQLRWELEVAVDGDEIELELELKWSTSARSSAEPMEEASGAVEEEAAAELETDADELKIDADELETDADPLEIADEPKTDADETDADETGAGQSDDGESVPEVSAEDETDEGESEQVAGPGDVESELLPAPRRSTHRAAGRRRATSK